MLPTVSRTCSLAVRGSVGLVERQRRDGVGLGEELAELGEVVRFDLAFAVAGGGEHDLEVPSSSTPRAKTWSAPRGQAGHSDGVFGPMVGEGVADAVGDDGDCRLGQGGAPGDSDTRHEGPIPAAISSGIASRA
ncbi:hypothetical protein ACWEOE_33495 [Amycolatopsis sp. NPDC004368]